MAVLFSGAVLVPAAGAKEPATPELSLLQAISLALAHSESVKKAEKEIERTEEWRNYRGEQLSYVPTSPPGTAAVEVPWSQLLMADLEWRMSKKTFTAEQDRVALDTCKKYWDVLQAQEKLRAAEAALKSAERALRNARVSYRVGVLTLAGLIGAEVQYRGAEAALAGARNDLDKAYVALNQAVGLWPEDRPVLTDTVEFEPLEVADLDYEVTKVLESAPVVWLAQERVTLQKYLEDMMFYTGEYRPYQARKIEVEQAELDAQSTREMFEQATRSLYYSVKSLEEAYAGAKEAVRVAEENLRVARLKLEVGMATAADVAAAEKELADAQAGAFELACQHAYMKLAFAKPWAYLGVSPAPASGSASGGAVPR
ncbi:TolC family protein [Candidatus Bipolaricaulota bacterium]|nr:TolC family protein [Candidatus Bipolaricaulota bacterium]